MKTIKQLFAYSLMMSLPFLNSSCKDYLTIDDIENKTIELGYYNSPQKIEQAVLGPYIDLRRGLVKNHAWLMYGDVRAGDMVLDLEFAKEVADQKLNSKARPVTQLTDWTYFYDAINNANKTLEIIESTKTTVLSSYQYKLYKGEMLAVKSLAYFYICRIWGDMPSAESSDLGTKLSKEQQLIRLEQWTKEAKTLLPWQLLNDDGIISPTLTAVRFNKTAASLLLADIQLTAGKRKESLTDLANILEPSAKDSLASFGLSLGKDTDASILKDPYTGMNIGLTLEKFNAIYPQADKRRSKFNMRSDGKGADLIIDETKSLMIYPVREVKLILAEASWKAGDLEIAKTYLKEASVGATEDYSLLNEQTFGSALLQERRRLLMGLGKRMFDINRFNRLREFQPQFSEADVQGGAAFWPLSARSIETNSLTQLSYWSK